MTNASGTDAWFDVVRVDTSVLTWERFMDRVERHAARAEAGQGFGPTPNGMSVMNTATIGAGQTGTIQVLAADGTYGVVCLQELDGGLAPHTPLGPIELT